jgi:hypothetical protein
MACLGLFVPGILQLHQYKNPININKILIRTISSSPELFAIYRRKIEKEHNQHIVPTKQHTTSNNQ